MRLRRSDGLDDIGDRIRQIEAKGLRHAPQNGLDTCEASWPAEVNCNAK